MLALNLHRHLEKRLWRSRRAAEFLFIDAPNAGKAQENNLAVVLICKDEEDYIDEWIKYHELAGVRHFYIYDNGSSDSTAAKARAHNREGEKTVIVHPWILKASAGQCAVCPQSAAYAHAVLCYGHKHRWMAFIDTDEFIVPRQHGTVIEALDRLGKYSNISLFWSQFGHCGHATKPSEPCAFAYMLRHQPDEPHFYHFKCIIDPAKLSMIYVHYYVTTNMGTTTSNDKGQVEENKNRTRAAGFVSSECLQLNHYRTKSIEESNIKLQRIMHGWIAAERKFEIYNYINEVNTNLVEDVALLDFLGRHGINNCEDYNQYINGAQTSENGKSTYS